MTKVGAIIVTFNPDYDVLKNNIQHIAPQVSKVVIIDNSEMNNPPLEKIEREFPSVQVRRFGDNKGIAAAQNEGFRILLDEQYEWVVTLDQDSEFMEDGVLRLMDQRQSFENVGMLVPRYVERNLTGENCEAGVEEVLYPISSGALVNVEAWEKIGGMDESLFIDRVDDDFDLRLRLAGYRLIQVNAVLLQHTIGDIREARIGKFKVVVFNHGATRKYYIARNAILYAKKHGNFVDALKRELALISKVLLFEKDKPRKLQRISVGIRDGFLNKKGRMT